MAKEKDGFVGEYNYYVGVLTESNQIRFVDSVDWINKSATWGSGQPAFAMLKSHALQLQVGLMCNGNTALVCEAPDFVALSNVENYG